MQYAQPLSDVRPERFALIGATSQPSTGEALRRAVTEPAAEDLARAALVAAAAARDEGQHPIPDAITLSDLAREQLPRAGMSCT